MTFEQRWDRFVCRIFGHRFGGWLVLDGPKYHRFCRRCMHVQEGRRVESSEIQVVKW